MSRLDVLNGSVSFHLFQHVVRVQSLGLLGVNGGRYMYVCSFTYSTNSFLFLTMAMGHQTGKFSN